MLELLIPEMVPYAASKTEARFFAAGSRFYRRRVSPSAYCYLALCPGRAQEACFSIEVGWSFGETIGTFNYLKQLRALFPDVGPSAQFETGFFGLHELEKQQAFWGEEILLASGSLKTAVHQAIRGVLDRVCIQLPRFETRLLEAEQRRAAATGA
jgi:hypothetical protein